MIQNLPEFLQVGRNIPSLVLGAGIFAKIILFILFSISVVAWTIMIDRYRLFRRIRAADASVRRASRKADSPAGLRELSARYGVSPLAALAGRACRTLEDLRSRLRFERFSDLSTLPEEEKRTALSMVRDGLEHQRAEEVSKLEKNLIFLATTASVSPFLGLLGTVWGIMSSFISMGVEGSASLNVVAPGIAEALITTVAGLAAAIPALVGYNFFVRQIRKEESGMERFELELVQRIEAATIGVTVRRGPTGIVEEENLSTSKV